MYLGYETISLQSVQLSELPGQIAALEESIETLQAEQTPASSNPSLSLPLAATMDLVASRQAELDELNRQVKSAQQALPRKVREQEKVENEVHLLEVQKAGVVAAAKEARRRKDDGERGIGDSLELRGRWYCGVETGLKDMLGV